jgi:hypothetical protein
VDTQDISTGDQIRIIGTTTGVYEAVINEMVNNDQPSTRVVKGDNPTFHVSRAVRRNDKVYKVIESKPSYP